MASSSYQRIYRVVKRIPRGRVATYGQIAALAGLGRQARQVGYALHATTAEALPWHRVINARGQISLPAPAGEIQRQLLEREGVVFMGDKVDLASFGWRPRGG